MTTSTKDLIELSRNRAARIGNKGLPDGDLFTKLADALERLTQPVGEAPAGTVVEPQDIADSDVVAVRVTASFISRGDHLFSAHTVALLIAERDAAIAALDAKIDTCGDARIHALQEQVKTLQGALEKIADWDASWGPYPENNEAWRAMVVVTAREAVPRAITATEPKDTP